MWKSLRRLGPRVTNAMKSESRQITRRWPQSARFSSIHFCKLNFCKCGNIEPPSIPATIELRKQTNQAKSIEMLSVHEKRLTLKTGRVGVISDTHGLVRPEAIQALKGSELILHAGDIGKPEVLTSLAGVAPVIAIRGNNDRSDACERREAR